MGGVLEGYQVGYIDPHTTTISKSAIERYRRKKMGKEKEVPVAKTRKVYAKTRGEHFKDMVIVALVVGILAFVAGVRYQSNQQTAVNNAVSQATVKK